MVNELLIRYSEDPRENKIASKIYSALRNNGIGFLEIVSSYSAKTGIFNVKYSFSQNDNPKLSTIEEILNNSNLLERIEIINSSK